MSNGDKQLIADALTILVRTHLIWYESSMALEYTVEALYLLRLTNNLEITRYTPMPPGAINNTQNNFTRSLEYYNDADDSRH